MQRLEEAISKAVVISATGIIAHQCLGVTSSKIHNNTKIFSDAIPRNVLCIVNNTCSVFLDKFRIHVRTKPVLNEENKCYKQPPFPTFWVCRQEKYSPDLRY